MQPNLPESVTIVEVGPRDGLQNEDIEISTEQKINMVNRLSQTGLTRIEVTSFTHPEWIPRLRDAESVMNGIDRKEGVNYSALVPNRKGYERAMECRVDEIVLLISASESHNKRNVNRTIDESLRDMEEIFQDVNQHRVRVRCVVAMAFECPFEGKVSIERVLDIVRTFEIMGADEIALADTAGLANPVLAAKVFSRISRELKGMPLAGHFHNTYGLGLTNILASMECGIRIFDASVGGLGGCPYIPDASGNIATEDLVYMLEGMGIETGVNLDKLMACSKLIGELVRKPASLIRAQK